MFNAFAIYPTSGPARSCAPVCDNGRTCFAIQSSPLTTTGPSHSTGSYRTVARATLADTGGACSSYARRLRIRSDGVYRVKVPSGDADHSTGISRRIRINAG